MNWRQHKWQFLLLLWTLVGLGLRFLNLTGKSPWMDELSTVIFASGNRANVLPVNQLIDLDTALQPIRPNLAAGPWTVAQNMAIESNHPPAYFMLAHLWMQFWAAINPMWGELPSIWVMRSLPALIGTMTIPLTFLLGWLATESLVTANLSAMAIALSPFNVYFAQEARHYALVIFLVTASLCCFLSAVRCFAQRRRLSVPIILLWVLINFAGLAVHHFFGLVLVTQGIVMAACLAYHNRKSTRLYLSSHCRRIYWAGWSMLVMVALWSPMWVTASAHPQSGFLSFSRDNWRNWLAPVLQSIASWISTIAWPATITDAWYGWPAVWVTLPIMAIFLVWAIPLLVRGVWRYLRYPDVTLEMQALVGFFVVANLLFFLITIGLTKDITRGHRYKFVYSPALMVMIAASLSMFWQERFGRSKNRERAGKPLIFPFLRRPISGRTFVKIVGFVACLSSLLVSTNLSLSKYYRPYNFVSTMQAQSVAPVVFVDTYAQTEKPTAIGLSFLSIVWEVRRNFAPALPNERSHHGWVGIPQYGLFRVDQKQQLAVALNRLQRPLDVWAFGIKPNEFTADNCDFVRHGKRGSYRFYHYFCR